MHRSSMISRILPSPTVHGKAVVIETERLLLRRLDADDASFMLALLNDAAFLEHIGDRGVRTLDDARRYILNGPVASYLRHGFGFYCVATKCANEPIGICGIACREGLEDADIGFAFLSVHRARGYALESALAVMRHAREDFGMRRVIAIVAKGNHASARLLEKLGLGFERMVRLGDREIRLFAWNA